MSRHTMTDKERANEVNARARIERERQIERWLKANPEIGRLNGDKFYRVEDGKIIEVEFKAA